MTAVAVIAASAFSAHGALLYTKKQYNDLHNDKIAVELELASVLRKYQNEKSNLEAKIAQLQSNIENLNSKIANLENQNAKDKDLCDSRIKELEGTIDILKQKSGNREQDLLVEIKKQQERYEKELVELRKELESERNKHQQELADLRKNSEATIAELKEQIGNLTNELNAVKKLNKAQESELQRMAEQASELEKRLSKEIQLGQIRLKRFHDKLIINLDDTISFASGSAELKPEILPALDTITKILVEYSEYNIVVEGHTDNIPIKTVKFRNNWQLSTERALAVVEYILKVKELNKQRFGAAGYAEFHPIVSNDTPQNRSLNRRVDIVVLPRSGK
jgi:chemotaxis protein MotB